MFRFLTDKEFFALDTKAKAVYLVKATEEVEARQTALGEYHMHLNQELDDKPAE